MIKQGDIIDYREMCSLEDISLQKGMNYGINGKFSIFLMSTRPGAPYEDEILDEGKTIIYEGHDCNKTIETPNPKIINQPMYNKNGTLTQNGLFFEAAIKYIDGVKKPELIKVYEKIRSGIWVYNGIFLLIDAWIESIERKIFKYKLELADKENAFSRKKTAELSIDRFIPSKVKQEVWKRDNGQCVKCGSKTNLHFDHIIPFSRGGSSLVAKNIQLLCAKHNLEKTNKIE